MAARFWLFESVESQLTMIDVDDILLFHIHDYD